jgi:hypothetical protein
MTSVPSGESGGFVATLGRDTVHLERFTRTGNTVAGTILVRTPAFRVINWSMTVDASGRPQRYDVSASDAKDAAILNGVAGTLSFVGDSVTRDAYRNGQRETSRLAAPNGAFAAPGLPYVGVSYLMYEAALADARRRADSSIYLVSMLPAATAIQKNRAWFIGPDSAELNYFGVARSGYKFDARGALLRADWTGTTYRYKVTRVADVDIERIANAWKMTELAGGGVGPLSPRDSSKARVGNADVSIDYSRPAARGRNIWGDVVPWNKVWRLGADVATHFATSADLVIGDANIPAGRYTLWMVPSENAPSLIVSSAVNVFGTAYTPAKDFARIPLRRVDGRPPVERLTIGVDAGLLMIQWGEIAWSVPMRAR